MKSHLELKLLMLILLINISSLFGQKSTDCYSYITLNEFLDNKIENDTIFIKQLYKNVKYPDVARMDQLQAKIEIMIIDHTIGNLEIIVLNQSSIFYQVKKQISQSLNKVILNRSVPYITRFHIYYSLDKNHFPEDIEPSRYGVTRNGINIVSINAPTIIMETKTQKN